VLGFFSSRSKGGPTPSPSPAGECVPPGGGGRRWTQSLAGEGVRGVPIRTRGQASGTLWNRLYQETCAISNISLESMLIVYTINYCTMYNSAAYVLVCANRKLVNTKLLPYFAERAVERGDSCSTASQSPCASWI
jgi:hypothetical protein